MFKQTDGLVACAHHHRSQEAETSKSLGLTRLLTSLISDPCSQGESLSQNRERKEPEVELWR